MLTFLSVKSNVLFENIESKFLKAMLLGIYSSDIIYLPITLCGLPAAAIYLQNLKNRIGPRQSGAAAGYAMY